MTQRDEPDPIETIYRMMCEARAEFVRALEQMPPPPPESAGDWWASFQARREAFQARLKAHRQRMEQERDERDGGRASAKPPSRPEDD
jgi:hypothetical protein